MSDGTLTEALAALNRDAAALHEQIKAVLPELAEARRRYAKSMSADDRQHMDEVQARLGALHFRFSEIVKEMQKVVGISDEMLDQLEKEQNLGDQPQRLERGQLTAAAVPSNARIEDLLGNSIDRLRRIVDPAWLEKMRGLPHRLVPDLFENPLSLVRGLRPESEFPLIHRFAQAMLVGQDFLEENIAYDHFAGAMLVPQIASLGSKLDVLKNVKGPVDARLESLWRGSTERADSTTFEILVAAGCAEKGRDVEFLEPLQERTPDLRCHDPYPLVIECKRKRSLSEYELIEERHMRVLFEKLRAIATKNGLFGRFYLELAVEADRAPQDEIVACMMRQRLAGRPERPLDYPWGNVAYRELPSRFSIPETRLYSPNMLRATFQWESDLPTWDGLICNIQSGRELVIDEVSQAIALLWTNKSDQAIKKRSWGPTDIFGDAVNQIPLGEFGIIYVAYHEGTREEIADLRTSAFVERLRDFYHPGKIRIPLSFLVRLYPRALNEGQPDLIESTIYFTGEYADSALKSMFPSPVFTSAPHEHDEDLE